MGMSKLDIAEAARHFDLKQNAPAVSNIAQFRRAIVPFDDEGLAQAPALGAHQADECADAVQLASTHPRRVRRRSRAWG
jgi:hypothetical protein